MLKKRKKCACLYGRNSISGGLNLRAWEHHRMLGSGRHKLRDLNADPGSLSLAAGDIHAEIRAVKNTQAFVNIADADSVLEHLGHPFLGNSHAVIFDRDDQSAVQGFGADGELAAAEFGGEAVLQRIFDNRLQKHARNEGVESVLVNLRVNHKVVAAEPRDFNIEIVVDKIEFLLKGHERLVLPQKTPQNIAQLDDHPARRVRIVANERRHRVKRIEQKVGIDLRGQRIHARLEQQLPVLFEIHFEARVAPNFHRNGDGHYRGQQNQSQSPALAGVYIKKPLRLGGMPERLAGQLQNDAGAKGQHFPGYFFPSEEPHEPAGRAHECVRPKPPNLLGILHELADQSAY